MRKLGKKILITALAAGIMTASVTGCSSVKGTEVVATLDGQDISLDFVNFYARYNQAQMEAAYKSLFGDDMWSADMTGAGVSYEETVKESIIAQIQSMLILEQHMDEYGIEITDDEKASISAAATQFLADNDAKTLKGMTATQQSVERYLTLFTISSKMSEAMVADVDTEVSDDEAAQKLINYVFISTAGQTDDDGNTIELTDAEIEAQRAKAEQILDLVDLDTGLEEVVAAVDEELSVSPANYGDDDEYLLDEIKEAADILGEGEYAPIVETESGFYVVQLVSQFDEEATENKKAEIVNTRKQEAYDEIYTVWEEASDFVVNSNVWSKVNFVTDSFAVYVEETESVAEETQAVDDAGADDKANE